ncbi:MAG: argininosuccinate lyase [Bacteroidetes bacterium]|nr:argininosuccinate lyase [Bacteroidota bacterium]
MSATKLWDKGEQKDQYLEQKVHDFTVGNDQVLDLLLAPYDVLGSLAHIQMLQKQGLLHHSEFLKLRNELLVIYKKIESGNFSIRPEAEDIHSEIEIRLTERLGDIGKKIHTGRSRNDQVLLDIKLFSRAEVKTVTIKVKKVFNQLLELAESHKDKLIPGYTHLQVGMISSFGLWFSAYAEALVDDLRMLHAAYTMAQKNPLGSGAGYGGSMPLDRRFTTELLGFDDLNYNSVYAQMNRGKMERSIATGLASIASSISKFSMDACLYMNQNFDFISFPDALTTGSSIMPHKKNPDVFELIRAKCNKIQALPFQFNTILNNLPSGYHRDLQMIKEDYILSFAELNSCLDILSVMLDNIIVKDEILSDEKYKYLYSVEKVNQLVKDGMPFRDAYVMVGQSIENDDFEIPNNIKHTHEGSIGNLCLNSIDQMMKQVLYLFKFDQFERRIEELLKD